MRLLHLFWRQNQAKRVIPNQPKTKLLTLKFQILKGEPCSEAVGLILATGRQTNYSLWTIGFVNQLRGVNRHPDKSPLRKTEKMKKNNW